MLLFAAIEDGRFTCPGCGTRNITPDAPDWN